MRSTEPFFWRADVCEVASEGDGRRPLRRWLKLNTSLRAEFALVIIIVTLADRRRVGDKLHASWTLLHYQRNSNVVWMRMDARWRCRRSNDRLC